MSKSKHTPGPWSREGNFSDDLEFVRQSRVIQNNTKVIAYGFGGVTFNGIDAEEAEANAVLIAAAPDLLEAAKAMVAGGYVMDADSPEWAPLQAAIAKAEEGI